MSQHIASQAEPIAKPAPTIDRSAVGAFVAFCGTRMLKQRVHQIAQRAATGARVSRSVQLRHAIELTVVRLMAPCTGRALPPADLQIARLAADLGALPDRLTPHGRDRLRRTLHDGLAGLGTLVPAFHLARTRRLQSARGFAVHEAGLDEDAPFDLLLARNGDEAELSCETVSAEDGRDLHRSAWFNLVDGIDPDLQTWLSAHPGRYLLKMTLPHGLRTTDADGVECGLAPLADLQRRIRDMLASRQRSDQDAAAVLRLDPLLLAGAQAGELGLMDTLREQFGPEAQLAVARSGSGVFAMAARAGRENDIGAAVRRRMQDATPRRFTGTRPGILAIFLDDTDRQEWRALRDGLQLEGETRQFLTCPEAARLVAVTVASRVELMGVTGDDAAVDGELRFRNQAHPAAKAAGLQPAISSSF